MERPDWLVWVERLRQEKESQAVEGKWVRISEGEGERETAVEEAGSRVGAERRSSSFPIGFSILARARRLMSPVFPTSSSLA